VSARERRDSPHGHPRETHSFDDKKHLGGRKWMATAFEGVSTVVARGMGEGAVRNLQSLGIKPILTELRTIDEVVAAVVSNTLVHRAERVHQRKKVEIGKNNPSEQNSSRTS
jgi:predicted Fe-Mo cluster-binding NifX family protein